MVEGDEARQLDEGAAVEQRLQLVFALPGKLHRVALAALPLPRRAAQAEREALVRHAPVPGHEVLLLLREGAALQDQSKHDVVAPPEKRAEGKFLLALEVLEIIQV